MIRSNSRLDAPSVAPTLARPEQVRSAAERCKSMLSTVVLPLFPNAQQFDAPLSFGGDLYEMVSGFDACVSVDARTADGEVAFSMAYRSNAPLPLGRHANRAMVNDFMAEIANQYVGLICSRLPGLERTSRMSLPYFERIQEDEVLALLQSWSGSSCDPHGFHCGWSAQIARHRFAFFCSLSIEQRSEGQRRIVESLIGSGSDSGEITWFDVEELSA
ncbi:MAG: hypothetical protein AAFR16_13295 [Pseudomonadota bacterium]